MALEDFKMKARRGTQLYPCGEWHGDEGSTFRISADGSYDQKRSRGPDRHGKLILNPANPWTWRLDIEAGAYFELILTEECKLQRLLYKEGKETNSSSATRQGRANLMNPKEAKDSWMENLRGIVQHVVENGIGERSMNSVHEIFEWVDGFNKRYEVHTGNKNPDFDEFMKCVANFVKELIVDSHSTKNSWPQRIVCATHFIGCLFKRWCFVTLKCSSWFRMLGWYETETQFHSALKACRDQFGNCLEVSKGRLHLYLKPLSDTNLRLLMEQLELVAATNESYAKEVPYACLLEMAIEVSGRSRTALPLKDLDEKDPLHKSFNLEFVLNMCANQSCDRQDFSLVVAQYMGLAAFTGCSSEEGARRLVACIDVVKDKLKGVYTFAETLNLANACCEGANSPELFKTVVGCLRESEEMKKCLTRFDEGKSIVDNVLWPLLQVHHFGSADLQEVLAYTITLQVESYWRFDQIAGCFLGVWRELSESKACKLNDAKQEFLHRVRSYDAFAAALLVALTKNPWSIELMLRGLKDGWMPPESLDMRCSLCLKLIDLLMQRGRSSLDERLCEEMLLAYCEASSFSELLPALIQPKCDARWVYTFLCKLQSQKINEEARCAIEKVVQRTARWSLRIDELCQRGQTQDEALWVKDLFLGAWVPSFADVAPESEKEQEFFRWLGVEEICQQPELVIQRLKSGSAGFIHHFLQDAPQGPAWVEEWSKLQQCAWPKLRPLMDVFGRFEDHAIPKSLGFFKDLRQAAMEGSLPYRAYVELSKKKPTLVNLMDNVDLICKDTDRCLDVIASHMEKCDLLRVELQRQLQLIEWLLREWKFDEIKTDRDALRQQMAKFENLTPRQVQMEVDKARDVFKRFNQLENGQETFNWLLHFMHEGSCLVNPFLQHFAQVIKKQHGRYLGMGSSDLSDLALEDFSEVVHLCYKNLQTLVGKTNSGPAAKVDSEVWRLAAAEFKKPESKMEMEISLLLNYFGGQDSKDLALPPAQQELMDAFHAHMVAGILWDFDTEEMRTGPAGSVSLKKGALQRLLEVMRLDWALQSNSFQDMCRLSREILSDGTVDIAADAKRLQEFKVGGLVIEDVKELQIFQTLADRVCVFDFLMARGFKGADWMELFRQRLRVVRESLEEDRSVRQDLLSELEHCASVLSGFLSAEVADPSANENWLQDLLQGIANCRSQPRKESFAAVADNLTLIEALFANADKENQGTELLLWSVREIMKGQLVIQGYSGSFYCWYQGAGRERVVVSSASLTEYSTRSYMSLEGFRQEGSNEAIRDLEIFLEKVRDIRANDVGLCATAAQLHESGHPKFRQDVTIQMDGDLSVEAAKQLDCLKAWRKEILATLEAAPLLGLVPRGQLHAWLASAQQSGITDEILTLLQEGLNVWVDFTDVDFASRLWPRRIPLNQPLEASRGLEALRCCCEHLYVKTPDAGGRLGRFLVQVDNDQRVLQTVLQLFLVHAAGPKRLPRPSEVLFCDDKVPLTEVQAFLWRSCRFPQLLFVLVEPNTLPLEGKKEVANWLVSENRTSSVGVISTTSWYTPPSAQVHPLQLRIDPTIIDEWKRHFNSQVFSYATGPSSGKSTYICRTCETRETVRCLLHEGFRLRDLVMESRRQIGQREGRHVAIHIEVNAYSDIVSTNTFLRHLFLCQVLYDPLSGQMVPIAPGTEIHVEMGTVVGKRDMHTMKRYATEELVQSLFPSLLPGQLNLALLYPILNLVAVDRSNEVRNFELLDTEQHYSGKATRAEDQVHWNVECDMCKECPVRGLCYKCVDCPDFDICARCYPFALEDHPPHEFGLRLPIALPFRVMHAFLQPFEPFEVHRSLLDIREDDLATLHLLEQEGHQSPAALRPLLQAYAAHVEANTLPVAASFKIDVNRFASPESAFLSLMAFAFDRCNLQTELTRAHQDLIVRRVGILSDWMARSYTFSDSSGGAANRLGSLLMECVVVALQKLVLGEEVCLHLVVPYTRKHDQEDFLIFVPSLFGEQLEGSSCSHGPGCACNHLRQELLGNLENKVLIPDLYSRDLLDIAQHDELQGIEALSCAFGLSEEDVERIIAEEGYILTRDFTSKILELLARRKSRVPTILVGESGTGKTRALELMMRLLVESEEVRPSLVQSLFDYMKQKLRDAKDATPEDPTLKEVEEILDRVLQLKFSVPLFQEILTVPALYQEGHLQEPLYTQRELLEWLLAELRTSGRFDVGRFHVLLRHLQLDRGTDQSATRRAVERARLEWESLSIDEKEVQRELDSLDLILEKLEVQNEDLVLSWAWLGLDEQQDCLLFAIHAISILEAEPVFFRTQVHAALTAADIEEKLQPALNACRREPDTTILCFLDEVNTASCLGFVKALLCDDFFGQHKNLFVVAAANPYREEEKSEDHVLGGSTTVMRDFFQVHPLPPSFDAYIWNWKSPSIHDEERYALLLLSKRMDIPNLDFPRFARAIADAQRFMRRELKSASAVSQRDIIRVVSLLDFFWRRSYSAVGASERCRVARALLLAFGVAFYLGLNRDQRERFVKEVTEKHYTGIQAEETEQSLELVQVLSEEMDAYIKPIKDDERLAHGIALTRALKENIFAVIVGIECNIPVMIVGMPGTGKTLAVNKATSVLRGASSVQFFRDFSDCANCVFRYQCSKDSTSRQIHEVFESALRAKQRNDMEDGRRRPVVFLDEAGLPKEKVESLKAIHYWIDDGRIFCCLLANNPLDAAKRNRCLQVFRDKADEDDLELLASECLGVRLEDPASKSMVKGFCGAFQEISGQSWKDQHKAFRIFHLRDFHHCLRYLRRHGHVQGGAVTSLSVLRALERNFGGLKQEDFLQLTEVFFRHLEKETDGLIARLETSSLRGILDILQEALEDLPPEDLQDASYEPCRFKLIIDETEDGGAVRILQSAGLLPSQWQFLEVSDLPGDRSELHRSQIVSNLRRAAEQAGTCVMIAYDEILDGFYDLLNLRFQRLPGQGRVRFAATVAAGSYSVLAPVDPRFMLVVCIKASELQQTPLPFLNRFEKFYLGPGDWAVHQAYELCLRHINHQLLQEFFLEPARGRLQALVQLVGDASLIGYSGNASLDSAICDALSSTDVKCALEALTSAWRQESNGRGVSLVELQPQPWQLPEDLDARSAIKLGLHDVTLRCYGHENAGNTCFLEACLTILLVHEKWMLPPQKDNEIGLLSDLRHLLKKSTHEVVGHVDMQSLAQKLEHAKIVEHRHMMDDAAIVLESILDKCESPKLPLQTCTCATPEDCKRFGYPTGPVDVVQDRRDYIIRTTPKAYASLQTLLQEAVLAPVPKCKVETTEDSTEHLLFSAIRAKQRPLKSFPPMALPICVERWNAQTMEKNNDSVSVPLEGLMLPLLPPKHCTLQLAQLELWRYNLRSFVLHLGSDLQSGHYIAYWKSAQGWQEVNDDRCSVISEQDAQRKAGSAYLLVYELAGFEGSCSWDALNAQADSSRLLDNRLKDVIAAVADEAAGRLLCLAPSEAVLSRSKSLPRSLLQGYVDRPHTGLGSVLAAVEQQPGRRFLVLTRDVLLASGLCPSEHLKRRDVEIHAMPRTREEAVVLLRSHRKERPLMIVCRLAGLVASHEMECTTQAIHQLRRLADELDVQRLVVTVLLPPWRFHVGRCYDSTFLGHWQILHLDSLEDSEAPTLVASILTNTQLPDKKHLISQEEVHKDLWAALTRLPVTDAMRRCAEGWEEVEPCMAHAVTFYTQPALQTRVDALWNILTNDNFALILDQLRLLRLSVLEDVSLQQEAIAAAKEMLGMDRGQRRPMLCLQTTVGHKCDERVVSALAAALHLICDQGGVQVLLQMGGEATFAVATYMGLRALDSGFALSSTRPLQPPQDAAVLPCYPHLFQVLQECLLDSRAEDCEEEYLVKSIASVWQKHPFFELSSCVVNSGLMGSYCRYIAQRFGFPSVAASLLQAWAEPYGTDEQLPGLHACAWCHRSDFLALSYLFRDGVPSQVLQQLKSADGRAAMKRTEALFGQGLASTVLQLLEEQLQAVMTIQHGRKAHLNSWHYSFAAARATVGGRLPMSRSCRMQLHRLSFFSDLIPCLMDHEGGLDILAELLEGSMTMDRREMQDMCLKRLAMQLEHASENELVTARSALQQILDDLLGPLRRVELSQIVEVFAECVELVLDIVDSRGIFGKCYGIVTPALGAAALEALLEALVQYRGKRGKGGEMLQRFSRAFCNKVGEHPCIHHTLKGWMEWMDEQSDPDTSSLPYLLYYAWRKTGSELLELACGHPLDELRRDRALPPSPNVFEAVRRAARQQHLINALAEDVARMKVRGAQVQHLLAHLEPAAEEDGNEEWMIFLNALVHRTGSTAAAGKALQELLQLQEGRTDTDSALHAWATVLVKPDRATGGPGEDPWEDLPVSSMPGYEHERERRLRQDQERERQDQQLAARGDCRCCPHCGKVIEKNAGCDQMVCGAHAHGQRQHQEGCGQVFLWSQAPRYQPTLTGHLQAPAGFSAILAWVMKDQDFQCAQAAADAEVAFHGLCPEDRRYAFANACACSFAKGNKRHPDLAMALTAANTNELRASLGYQDQRLARLAAVLCDPATLPDSNSLVAAVLLGRDDWDQVAATEKTQTQRLKNALLNLLVAVLGSPDNNHLMMLLLEPNAMLHSFPVGFVYQAMPGPEGYHFDCGCVLDAQGRARRPRAPLGNIHLHFVNFCSWAMISVGLLVFPQNCENIGQVLTDSYIQEVAGRRAQAASFADNARTFSMNYALQMFECVCRHQGLTDDDRALAFSRLFRDFRQRAVANPPDFARTFGSPEQRERYEEIWRIMIDGIKENLDELRTQAHEDSRTQSQLLQLQEFRSSLSYMQLFFHDYEKCSLDPPFEPELKFVADLVIRKEELSHLPLLGHLVRLRNWIFDRLDGALPKKDLEKPLKVLLEDAMEKDEKMNHRSKKSHCEATLHSLKLFVDSWKAFYDANNGAIPIECHAGRAAMGGEAQETHLVRIGDEELPLSFFLNSQSLMVGKFLCNSWNELVDSAAFALDQLGKSHTTNWAKQMKKAAHVGLADLFFQEQLVETLQSDALQRCVRRNLRSPSGRASEWAKVDWGAVQLEILSSSWIHRIQKLEFPAIEDFISTKQDASEKTAHQFALSDEKHQEVLHKLPRMQPAELQVSRDWVQKILPKLGASEASTLVMDNEDVKDQLSSLPEATVEILEGIRVAALPQLLQLLEQENGSFGHQLSPLLKEPSPCNLQDLFNCWANPSSILSRDDLDRQQKVLRETIENLQNQNFCEHAISHASLSLLETYTVVFAPDDHPLERLPDEIRCCHLLSVVQGLQNLLREFSYSQAEMYKGIVWDSREGLHELPEGVLLAEAKSVKLPKENLESTKESFQQIEPSKDVEMTINSDWDVLAFMCWACQDQDGDGECPMELMAETSVKKLLKSCGFTENMNRSRDSDDITHEECVHRFLEIYEKQVMSTTKERSSASAWQRSLSEVQLVPLQTLLEYKDCDGEAVRKELWQMGVLKFSQRSEEVVLKEVWQRFVHLFIDQNPSEVEEAMSGVLGDKMPKIVQVPREAEELALSGQDVILKVRDQYFEVTSLSPSVEVEAAYLQSASLKASLIQRHWRRWHEEKPVKAPLSVTAEVVVDAMSENHFAEPMQEEPAVPNPTSVVEVDLPTAPPRETATEVWHGKAGNIGCDLPVQSDTKQDLVTMCQANSDPAFVPACDMQSNGYPPMAAVACAESEEIRSIRSIESHRSVKVLPGEASASRLERFILEANSFYDMSCFRTIPDAEGKCESNFEIAMRHLPDGWAKTLRKECIMPIKKSLRRKFSSLTEDELFALVSYSYDLRKKYPQAAASLNFAACLSRFVVTCDEEAEMNVCIHHFKTAVEKRQAMTVQPTALYCVVLPDCMEQLLQLENGEEVYWPTFTSWSPSKEAMEQAASAVSGFVVRLDAPRSAGDISVFRSACREAGCEFVLPVNACLLVKMISAPSSGQSRVVLELEEVKDDDED